MILTLIIVAAIILIYIISAFNTLVRKRNHAENTFATIDVMLRKRFDLIPNLVKVVKGYAQHEAGVLAEIVKLRNKTYDELTTEQKIKMDQDLQNVQSSLNILVEEYPDLKASQNFLDLQGSLNETEEQLAAARRTYNAAITAYNNTVQTFPSNIVASVARFKVRPLLETSDVERKNINIQELINN